MLTAEQARKVAEGFEDPETLDDILLNIAGMAVFGFTNLCVRYPTPRKLKKSKKLYKNKTLEYIFWKTKRG